MSHPSWVHRLKGKYFHKNSAWTVGHLWSVCDSLLFFTPQYNKLLQKWWACWFEYLGNDKKRFKRFCLRHGYFLRVLPCLFESSHSFCLFGSNRWTINNNLPWNDTVVTCIVLWQITKHLILHTSGSNLQSQSCPTFKSVLFLRCVWQSFESIIFMRLFCFSSEEEQLLQALVTALLNQSFPIQI